MSENGENDIFMGVTDDEKTTNEIIVLNVYLSDVRTLLDQEDTTRFHSAFALFRAKIAQIENIAPTNLSPDVARARSEALATAIAERDRLNTIISYAARLTRNNEPTPSTSSNVKWEWKPVYFYGRASEWAQWWDIFRSGIHEHKALDDSFKMKSLSECLRRDARLALGTMSLTGANYAEAIRRLLERYNDALILTNSYYEELETMPVSSSISTHQKTLDQIAGIVNNLETLRPKIAINDQSVVANITKKFPDDTLRWALIAHIAPNHKDLQFKPKEYVEALEQVVRVDNFISTHKNKLVPVKPNQETPLHDTPPPPNKTLGTFSAGTKRRNEQLPCIFCGNKHSNADCSKFATIAARKTQLDVQKRCNNCLQQFHFTKDCKREPAKCKRCDGAHNTAMCIKRMSDHRAPKRGKSSVTHTFLQTFIANIQNIEVRGLLDPGANASYINHDLVRKLKIPLGESFTFDCVTFAESQENFLTVRQVTIKITNYKNETREFNLLAVKCIMRDMVTSPPPSIVNKFLPKNFDYSDTDIFHEKQRPIELLLGGDIYYSLINTKRSKLLSSGIILIPSFFGWVVAGSVDQETVTTTGISLATSQKITEVDLNKIEKVNNMISSNSLANAKTFDLTNLQKLWTLETIGIEHPDKHISDEIALEKFRESAFIEDSGRYNVRFPWKNSTTTLPSNYRIALARLKNLTVKTQTDVLEKANEHFNAQLNDGIIEVAPPTPNLVARDEKDVHRVHYLPFKLIFRKGKLRVVYDASAKTASGLSLNDMILQGLNLTEDLVKLLLNFRVHKIGLTADIEKAYLQISLNEADRDVTRFLWLKDITRPPTPDNLTYLRFARVPFGVNASPFLLNIVLKEVFAQTQLFKNGQLYFYVDNFVKSVNSTVEAMQHFNVMTTTLNGIKMNLRDWASNDAAFANAIPKDKSDSTTGKISILGLKWNREADTLSIEINDEISNECTKRSLLKFLGSVYDPLGLFAPCVVDLKILIQRCWKDKYDWDEKLPPSIIAEWQKIKSEILNLPNVEIPRRYWLHSESAEKYELHVFCDASDKAFACCAYLLNKSKNQTFACSLIFSKIRISPITKLTIPKLELMGVVLGKRTTSFLIKNLEIEISKAIIWTDATTVLQWMNAREVLPPFVQNRVNEIKNAYNVTIRYVPSQDNPADSASRGKNIQNVENNTLWWHGPEWLPYEPCWPALPLNTEIYESPKNETPNKIQKHIFVIGEKSKKNKPATKKKARRNRKCKRRSKHKPALTKTTFLTDYVENKLNTWTARVQFFSKIIKACSLIKTNKSKFRISESACLRLAEKLLIIELQQKYYPDEYDTLIKGGRPRDNLDLFLDSDKIIRCRGRLMYARFPWEMTHPILLPRNSKATYDYVKELHKENMHIGASHTLAKLRERFWIPSGRVLIRSVIHHCYECRYWEGGSYPLPNIPPLPEIRLRDCTPFLQVGIDFFGPLHIKIDEKDTADVYVLMCTCLVTRAIHLELVPDLTGEQFLLALQRFASLKRLPKTIISDNGTTFTFVQPLVGIEVKIIDTKIDKFINSNRINWYFIPQYAPWFGGAYERLNGLVKRCLKKSYGKILLTYFELQTVIYEVADIMNSRPLIYVSGAENAQTITPNDLWKPGETNKNMTLEPPEKVPKNIREKELIERWRIRSNLIDAYWEAFQHLYLLSLRERHTIALPKKKGSVPYSPKIGDIVLVQEPSLPRSYWKLGRIEKLDQRQAVADLKWKGITTRRSIRQLYPIPIEDYVIPTTTIPTQPVSGPLTSMKPVAGPLTSTEPVPGPSTSTKPVSGPSTSNEPVSGPSTSTEPVAGPSTSTELVLE